VTPAVVTFHCPTYLCCSEEKQATDFNLGDVEDDFITTEELAEEVGREVKSVNTYAPNVRKRQRCLDWFPRQHLCFRSCCLDVSGGDISGEAVASQLLFLPGRGALETWRRGLV
jgi:hypothetical protein